MIRTTERVVSVVCDFSTWLNDRLRIGVYRRFWNSDFRSLFVLSLNYSFRSIIIKTHNEKSSA